jgi:hypothetical protein
MRNTFIDHCLINYFKDIFSILLSIDAILKLLVGLFDDWKPHLVKSFVRELIFTNTFPCEDVLSTRQKFKILDRNFFSANYTYILYFRHELLWLDL